MVHVVLLMVQKSGSAAEVGSLSLLIYDGFDTSPGGFLAEFQKVGLSRDENHDPKGGSPFNQRLDSPI